MIFKNGFRDINSERNMISARIERLCKNLWEQYYCYSSYNPGEFLIKEGLYQYEELQNLDFEKFDNINDRWGGQNQNVWFIHNIIIPEEMEGKTVFYSLCLTDNGGWYWGAPQVLAYVNGKPVTGMDVNHREILLTDCAEAGSRYEIALCAFTDRFFYKGKIEMNMLVMALNPFVNQLYYDIRVPYEIAEMLDVNDSRRIDILSHLNTALSLVDFRLPTGDESDKTILDAQDYMNTEFYGKFCGQEDATVTCIAHTHIDTAWLWTLEQTKKKVARSFSTVLKLMDEYDDFQFMSSQPQLYIYLKDNYPEIYAKIQQHVDNGRWEPEGGMWIEADTNITSGESLIRQILFGKRFFKQEFGVDSKILWLPDVFGYSAALPQIMKKSGLDYFMTTKISWNIYNKFPFDTFLWRGIDGSEVLSHFICSQDYNSSEVSHLTTYNGYLDPAYVMGAWRRYQQKDLNRDILFSFGYGDGGGGPSREMIEKARRMEKGIPGCPKVKFDTVKNYFTKLDKEVGGNKNLPTWVGELYFEYHSGTYTSVGKIKKNNRKCEILMQDVELLNSINCIVNKAAYPQKRINISWQTLLLNQFHDILPGSSIKEVYDDSDIQFKEVFRECSGLLSDSFHDICSSIDLTEESVVVFNTTTFIRSDIVEVAIPLDNFEIFDGQESIPWQKTCNGSIIFFASDIPAKGYKTYTIRAVCGQAEFGNALTISETTMTNRFYDMELDLNGNISSLFDKVNDKEVAVEGNPMNRIIAFEDVPTNDDAWNINAYFNEKFWCIDNVEEITIKERGPVRQILSIRRRFVNSTISQDIVMYADLPRIDVVNEIDWKESNILLKADFPFTANATRATYDIQFGNIERATTTNTSWDFAQYEVSAHRWADLSQEDYGLSILNDCKYGYDIKNSHVRITLLKSPVYPNPLSDKEIHQFTYSIYPHIGTWRNGGTVSMAAFLNCPILAKYENAHKGSLPVMYSLVRSDCDNVLIETVKKAEDSDEYIIRINECYNRTSKVKLVFAGTIRSACECNMMEEEIGLMDFDGNTISITCNPYEIKTLKVGL